MDLAQRHGLRGYDAIQSYYIERVAGVSRSEYEMIIWGNQFTALLQSLWKQGVGDIGLVTPVVRFARQKDESFEQ
jgi:hypothetical protein